MTRLIDKPLSRRRFLSYSLAPAVLGFGSASRAQTAEDGLLARPLLYDATVSNIQCDAQPGIHNVTFTVCNNETGSIVIEEALLIPVGKQVKGAHFNVSSPNMPVKIYSGQCADFVLVSGGKPVFKCGDSVLLVGRHVNDFHEAYLPVQL